MPAGNAVAARVLLRLGYLLGEPRYLMAAERTLRAAWPVMLKYPKPTPPCCGALEQLLSPPEIVLLRGPEQALEPWLRALNPLFEPRRYVLGVPDGLDRLPEAIASKPGGAAVVAYVCRGTHCTAPLASLEALLAELSHPQP